MIFEEGASVPDFFDAMVMRDVLVEPIPANIDPRDPEAVKWNVRALRGVEGA